MKRFLVISDTHVPVYQRDIPKAIYELAGEVNGVIALGDFVDLDTVLTLESISKVFYGVHGNMDHVDVKEHLPDSKILVIEGLTIAMTHGWGAPWGIHKRILRKFSFDPDIDLILYGHTHQPFDGEISGKRFLNPGSTTPGGTYAIMEIDGRDLRFEIRHL